MGVNYGLVYDASTAESQLQSMNRDYYNRLTWQNLFNSNTIAGEQAKNQLTKSYNDASAEAYVSYLQSQNAIKNSQIVGSGKSSLLASNDSALQEAYESYQSSLASGISSIEESVAETEESIQSALTEQAEYTADYTNAHYDYLAYLYEQYLAGEADFASLFGENGTFSKYITYDYLLDDDGNIQYDENGDAIFDTDSPRIMTVDDFTNVANGYFNEDGTLTSKGIDFFDQLENQLANEGGYSWGQYLAENNSELLEWANSYNPYNYTQEGTNAGTMRTMYGMMSTDETYYFAERFGGLSESEIDALFEDYQAAYESLVSSIESKGKDKGQSYVTEIQDYVSSLQAMAESLGLDADLEEYMGTSWEEISETIAYYLENTESAAEMVGTFFGEGSSGAVTYGSVAGMAAAIGAAAGVASTGVGAIIVGVGILLGLTVSGSIAVDEQRTLNKQLAEYSNELFNTVLTSFVTYMQQGRVSAQKAASTNIIY